MHENVVIDVNTQEGKKIVGLENNETGYVGDNNFLVAKTWDDTNHRRVIGKWFAVSVPGNIVSSLDNNFSRVYATKNIKLLKEILNSLSQYYEAERKCLQLLSTDKDGFKCPELNIPVSQCQLCR